MPPSPHHPDDSLLSVILTHEIFLILTHPFWNTHRHQSSDKTLRYRGLELCHALPIPFLTTTILRVLKGLIHSINPESKMEVVLATLSKLKQVFHPTEQVRRNLHLLQQSEKAEKGLKK